MTGIFGAVEATSTARTSFCGMRDGFRRSFSNKSSPWLDKLANALALVLLIEMMVAAGLGVSLGDLVGVVRKCSSSCLRQGAIMYSFRTLPSLRVTTLFNSGLGISLVVAILWRC